MLAVQPCALLVLIGPDWRIETIGANAGLLGDHKPAALVGQPLAELIGGQAMHALRNRLAWLSTGESDVHDFGIRWGDVTLDIRASGDGNQYLIEAELAVEPRLPDAIGMVRSMNDRLIGTDPRKLSEQAMRQLCVLTGFDQMMLSDCQRRVINGGERGALPKIEAPASNGTARISLISDRDAEPVPLLGNETSKLLSRAAYLGPDGDARKQFADLGVAAAMSFPLKIDGELVATLHAHHGVPRRCGAERRGVAHLFAERLVARMARHGWTP